MAEVKHEYPLFQAGKYNTPVPLYPFELNRSLYRVHIEDNRKGAKNLLNLKTRFVFTCCSCHWIQVFEVRAQERARKKVTSNVQSTRSKKVSSL